MPIAKETRQKMLRLRELRDQAGSTLYERIKLAYECLQDPDFVEEIHGGKMDRAEDAIASEYFPDLVGPAVARIDFAKMLAIYRQFSDEQTWKDHKYNLIAMEILYDEKRKREKKDTSPPQTRWAVTRKQWDDLESEKKALERQVKKKTDAISAKDEQIEGLRAKVQELESENAYLKGRISQLEAQVKAA
jgi:nitrogen fixation-related uncharacterized protein